MFKKNRCSTNVYEQKNTIKRPTKPILATIIIFNSKLLLNIEDLDIKKIPILLKKKWKERLQSFKKKRKWEGQLYWTVWYRQFMQIIKMIIKLGKSGLPVAKTRKANLYNLMVDWIKLVPLEALVNEHV